MKYTKFEEVEYTNTAIELLDTWLVDIDSMLKRYQELGSQFKYKIAWLKLLRKYINYIIDGGRTIKGPIPNSELAKKQINLADNHYTMDEVDKIIRSIYTYVNKWVYKSEDEKDFAMTHIDHRVKKIEGKLASTFNRHKHNNNKEKG